MSVSWLCCVLLLLPRVAKLMINFDSTRRRDSMRGSGETIPIPKQPQRQPVSVAAYYCVFVPTVAVRFRSSTQLSSSPPHTHTHHTTAYRHHTHTTQLNSHARSLCHFASLSLLGTGRAVAAEQQQQQSSSKGNQPPECIARSLAHTATAWG